MRADRLLGILLMLLDRKRMTASELARAFEVSTRTIYRDVEALGTAGVPVYAVSGVGGGIEILPTYKVKQGIFTDRDLASLLSALNGFAGIADKKLIAETEAKVRALIPSDRTRMVNSQANQLNFDHSPWIVSRELGSLVDHLRDSIRENLLVSFEYVGRDGSISCRIVEPYSLLHKHGAWYVHAYCHEKEAFRLFKLARIHDLRRLETGFSPREIPQLEKSASIYVSERTIYVTIRVHRSILERVLDLCPFEDCEYDGDDHYVVRHPFVDSGYYYDVLLSYGEKCEVLEPSFVREKLREKVSALASLYKVVQ